MVPSNYGYFVDGINYLSVEDIISINKFLIETQTPKEQISVINDNLLRSAQARPSMTKFYDQTDDVFYLCSRLIESLIKNHPFANANKRTAMTSGTIFLLINGYQLISSNEEFIEMGEGIALDKYNLEDIENWLCYRSESFDARKLCMPFDKLISFASSNK